MSRNPRAGTCPALTRTEQLRRARSAALVKESQKRGTTRQPEEFKVRKRYERPDPKKVDFTKPGMTKAMMARVKQAEKFKQEYESKKETYAAGHFPRRTPAPIGGDARMGRERITGRRTPAASPPRAPQTSRRAGPSVTPSKRGVMRHSPRAAEETVPAGTVSGDRTAIVSIVQPGEGRVASPPANRSIQVISETLDEQDAVESGRSPHPDLWDIEDPWGKPPPPQPDMPDLIEFEEDDLIQFD